MRVSGTPIADLLAKTTGTDADWVVKLIDVYPDEVPSQMEWGGYQLACPGYFPRAVSVQLRTSPSDSGGKDARVQVHPADGQSRVRARSPDYGANPIELASPVRPQSAEVRGEHFQRKARGLYEGDANGDALAWEERRGNSVEILGDVDVVVGGSYVSFYSVLDCAADVLAPSSRS